MWHEARRQEKKIRGLMVDFKKRADRRKEFYEKIKLDPTQFLRVYGRPCKINYDPAVALAAESPQSMMPWQGDIGNMIDRFDVRAHLDIIPEVSSKSVIELTEEEEEEERRCNYERYRTLVENGAAGLSEEQCLRDIYIDEHFGPPSKPQEEEKKKSAEKKAAIGYKYEDSTPSDKKDDDEDHSSDEESSDTDVETADLDVTLNVDELTVLQEIEINSFAQKYGMKDEDFVSMLRQDKEELEALKHAKQIEEEKAQFSGRKSRRERRAFKEKQLQGRRISPPSYAARSSPKYETYRRSRSSSRSRSRSPANEGQVKFITSFGAESDEEGATVQGPSLPPAAAAAKSESSTSLTDSKSDSNRHHSWKNKGRPSNLRRKSTRSRSRSRSQDRSRSRSSRIENRNRNIPGQRRRSRSGSTSYLHSRDSWRRDSYDHRAYRYGRQQRMGRFNRDRRQRSWSRNRSRGYRSRSVSRSRVDRRSITRSRSKSQSRSTRSKSASQSRSRSSGSKSSSRSLSKSCSRSKSRSVSGSRDKERAMSTSPKQPVVIKRYRRDSLSSHSGLSDVEDIESTSDRSGTRDGAEAKSKNRSEGIAKAGNTSSVIQGKLTPQERLKRKMQAQLNRQYKADKKAEITKISKQEQERLDREEELRNRTMEMRRREREKRHRELEELERERRARKDRGGNGDRHRRRSSSYSRSVSPMDTRRHHSPASRSGSESDESDEAGLVSY